MLNEARECHSDKTPKEFFSFQRTCWIKKWFWLEFEKDGSYKKLPWNEIKIIGPVIFTELVILW